MVIDHIMYEEWDQGSNNLMKFVDCPYAYRIPFPIMLEKAGFSIKEILLYH